MVNPLWKSLAVPPKVKHGITMWRSNSTPRYKLQGNEYKCPYKNSYIIPDSQEVETTQRPPNWRIKSQSHTTEHCSAIKRNEVLIHVTTWMNPESIPSKEARQRTKTVRFHLYEMFGIGKSVETERRLVVAKSWERGEWRANADSHRVSFGHDKTFWGWVLTMVAKPCEYWKPLNYALWNLKFYHKIELYGR